MTKHINSEELAWNVRYDVLEMVHNAHASHIGAALSVTDILAVLYSDVLKYRTDEPKWVNRDRLVLSKGHAGSALYATLAEVGFFDKSILETYDLNGSVLSGHISHKNVPGVEMSTGSLGHGVCVAAGFALAAKTDNRDCHVYAIVGDGECDEGTVWETIMFAKQFKLSNFTIIVDRNNMQAMGRCEDVIDTNSLADKFSAFGWNVLEIDGNNHDELRAAFRKKFTNECPTAIIANTIKGKGISFMENNLVWHYRDPQNGDYEAAKKELEDKKSAK